MGGGAGCWREKSRFLDGPAIAKSADSSTKSQRAEKKTSRPRSDASGGERAWLRHAAFGLSIFVYKNLKRPQIQPTNLGMTSVIFPLVASCTKTKEAKESPKKVQS